MYDDTLSQLLQNILKLPFRNEISLKISSKDRVQHGLHHLVMELEYLQGIGAGAGVTTSGEQVIIDKVSNGAGKKVIFDVGANEGMFTEMVESTLDSASVHLFEPQRQLLKNLNSKYSTDNSKSVNGFALSDECSEATLYYDSAGSGLGSMTKRDLSHFDISFDKSEKVTTRTLDWYCNEKGINHIDLLKLDVEGHEFDVLAGATEMISNQKIEFISFEFGGANIDTRTFFRDYWMYFDKHGYKLYRILPNKEMYHIPEYQEYHEKYRTTNYLAASPHAHSSAIFNQ